MEYAIQTRSLTRCFGKLAAVNDLDLQVPVGSIYGLIGPNGAGKTTTLRMLAGLLDATSGDIRINGLSTRQYWREVQWQVGYMPDFFGVYDDLLVWEYLDFFGRCYKIEADRRRRAIDDLLDLVDLSEKKNAAVNTLSRGMKQRLCLAHALVHDPKVLLLDEPASGLDPRARVEMRELLRELRAMGKTILLSSHILTELAELCDSIAIMERGRLVVSGSLGEIRSQAAQRRLRIAVLSDGDAALHLIESQPGVQQAALLAAPDVGRETALVSAASQNSSGAFSQAGGFDGATIIEVEFTGDWQNAADLLEALVGQGVRVASFAEVATDLEQAFLRLTKGEVA